MSSFGRMRLTTGPPYDFHLQMLCLVIWLVLGNTAKGSSSDCRLFLFGPRHGRIQKISPDVVTSLDATLTRRAVSIDFKRLTEMLNPLDATLTKKWEGVEPKGFVTVV
jgi:hypothetical protein